MVRVRLPFLLIPFLFTSSALAGSPGDVCNAIRAYDSFSSTKRSADQCDGLVSSGVFDEEASQVCLTIANMDTFSSTRRAAVNCVLLIKNKSFESSSVSHCQSIANKDSFSSTRRKAILCLQSQARDLGEVVASTDVDTMAPADLKTESKAIQPAESNEVAKTDDSNDLNIAQFAGSDIQATVDTIQVPQDGDVYFVVILKNVVVSGKQIGNIFLYPRTGTQREAEEFSAGIRSTIESKTFDDLPVRKITLHHLVDQDFTLSEITGETLEPDKDLTLKIGQITFEGRLQTGGKGQQSSFSFGLNVKK